VTTLRTLPVPAILALSSVFFGCAGADAVGPGPGPGPGAARAPEVSAIELPRTFAATPRRSEQARTRPALQRPRFTSSVFAPKAKGCR
jgi:hypothetical protein